MTSHSINLENLWKAAQANLITWSSVQAYQASLMPRCANHPDTPEQPAPPMATYQDSTPLCAGCYIAWIRIQKEEANV